MDRQPEPILSTPPQFVQLPDKYKCVQCHNPLLHHPFQTGCGHRFCSYQCFESLFTSSQRPKCPAGQEDCDFLSEDKVSPDIDAKKEMEQQLVKCTNGEYGCQESVAWKNLNAHVINCKHSRKHCPSKGCGRQLQPEKLKQHVEEECPYTEAPCPYCKKPVQRAFHKDHLDICPEVEFSCDECGKQNIPRKEMKQHKEICRSATAQSLDTLVETLVRKWEAKLSMADSEPEIITSFKEDTSFEEDTFFKTSSEIEVKVDELSKALQESEKKVDKLQSQQQIALDHHTRSLAQQLQKTNQEWAEKEEKWNLKQMQLEEELRTVLKRLQDVENSTISNSFSLESLRQDLAEFDLRVQCLETMETVSYNGKLILRVSDYGTSKTQNMVLDSQPFYTSRHGYKMCARLYLNGNGRGKGTHLSLYLVLMKGENDASLQWPFKGEITFTLMGFEGGKKLDSFRTDPTFRCFQRPQDEKNAAAGLPLFASHSLVETDTYLRKDTIFIKVVVKSFQD